MCSKITVTCTTTQTAKLVWGQWLHLKVSAQSWQKEEQHHKLCEKRCYAMGNISYEATPCNYRSCHHHDAYAQGLSAHTGIALPVLAEPRIIKPTQFKATAKFAHHCVV